MSKVVKIFFVLWVMAIGFNPRMTFAGDSPFIGIKFFQKEKSYGIVPDLDAKKVLYLTEGFHSLMQSGQYEKAYSLFSKRFRDSQLTLLEFISEVEYFDRNYGPERAFRLRPEPFPDRMTYVDPSQIGEALSFYDVTMVSYTSQRKKNVAMVFGVANDEGRLRIVLWGYSIPEDNISAEYSVVTSK